MLPRARVTRRVGLGGAAGSIGWGEVSVRGSVEAVVGVLRGFCLCFCLEEDGRLKGVELELKLDGEFAWQRGRLGWRKGEEVVDRWKKAPW